MTPQHNDDNRVSEYARIRADADLVIGKNGGNTYSSSNSLRLSGYTQTMELLMYVIS